MRLTVFCATLLLAWPAAAVEKFAMAVYHFNLQYVEGGLIDFPDGMTLTDNFNLDDTQLNDQIITQSFDPLLDMYLRHPTWGADIELQGYMMDWIAQRHPDTLAKMKQLAAAGKVTFDSFHWSDQFWLAYPRVDMERSYDLTTQAFANAGVPLSKAIFTQEGQFGMGMERFFRERGLQIAIIHGGVMGYGMKGFQQQPLFTVGTQPDVMAVVDNDFQDNLVQVKWEFHDDGERAMTGGPVNGVDPYLGKGFVFKPDDSAAYEAGIAADEQAGYQIVSVTEYAQRALALGEQPQPLPSVIDGTWHHDPFLWMGDTSIEDLAVVGSSNDNGCLTTAMQAHRKLLEAEEVVKQLGIHDYDAKITQAWRDLLLGEGSDGTGQNPWMGERKFSMAHSQSALDAANAILADQRIAPGLTSTATVPTLVADSGPFQLITDPNASRPAHMQWQKRQGTTTWELTVSFDSVADGSSGTAHQVAIAFPRTADDAIFSGALEDEAVRDVPLANIGGADRPLPDGGTETVVAIPGANGLIGLGHDTYVIKRTETVHVAAQYPVDAEEVRFIDHTADTDAITWKFVVVQGSQAGAIAEAKADNLDPEPVTVAAPKQRSCGCDTSAVDAGALLLAGLFAMRKRMRSVVRG